MAVPCITLFGTCPTSCSDGNIVVGLVLAAVGNRSSLLLFALWEGDLLMEIWLCLSIPECTIKTLAEPV
eukprot:5679540-Karenia_brevis.AAC.1